MINFEIHLKNQKNTFKLEQLLIYLHIQTFVYSIPSGPLNTKSRAAKNPTRLQTLRS